MVVTWWIVAFLPSGGLHCFCEAFRLNHKIFLGSEDVTEEVSDTDPQRVVGSKFSWHFDISCRVRIESCLEYGLRVHSQILLVTHGKCLVLS